MKIKTWMFLFLIVPFLTSCQVKESSGSGGLIANHTPTTNAFTIVTPSAHTYVTGDDISITLTFPYNVTVTGTPQLVLNIGGTSRDADYDSGSGTRNLVFTYTVDASDDDSDGIRVSSLSLNGGTLRFDNNGVMTNCSTSITARTFSNVLVDNSGPEVSAFAITTAAGFYNLGETISFRVTYNEPVTIAGGVPSITLGFTTGGSGNAVYTSGSGTNILIFTYTVASNQADINGYNITTTMALNGATIKDASGNDAEVDLSSYSASVQTATATRDFDGRLPFVTSVSVPASGTYGAAQNLDFTLTFNRNVNVTVATPYLSVVIGSNTRQATYISGSGTTALVFRYTTVPGDVDDRRRRRVG